jgi:hypothetical protein
MNIENWNWNEYLNAPNEVKSNYYEEARERSSNYTTCACGQFCKVLPKSVGDIPLDEKLRNLGVKFYDNIIDAKFETAKATLLDIELRTAFLLTQENFIDEIK